jgi:hypothetical protein
MKIWLVVELYKNGEPPRILGCYRSKKSAEAAAYDPRALVWRNIIPLRLM